MIHNGDGWRICDEIVMSKILSLSFIKMGIFPNLYKVIDYASLNHNFY